MSAGSNNQEDAPLIRTAQLCKHYENGDLATNVLLGIDLKIQRGAFVAIMGQSGSGKSTLMNVLGCLDRANEGNYWLDGQDTAFLSRTELARLRNRTIGFVFQGFNLVKRMSAVENVALPLVYAGLSRASARTKALASLGKLGMSDFAERRPTQLSGGQQQRVAIARAIVGDPLLLLADEPTGSLDTRTGVEIMNVFRQLNQECGITIVIVTHETEIAAYSERLLRLVDGKLAYDGATNAALEEQCSQGGKEHLEIRVPH